MTKEQVHLSEKLKRLGFTRENQIRLYGMQFELVGDPVVINDHAVFVYAMEMKSGQLRRVRIPMTILNMASKESP
jgi:hypothetical protein